MVRTRGTEPGTPKKEAKFLESLRSTGGNVSRACAVAQIVRRTVYKWRESDKGFAAAWDEAVEAGTDELEEEARRRAFQGVDEPVFYKGDICGEVRKYSDVLLIFLLKGRRPEKYRERHEVSGVDGVPLMQPVADAMLKIYGATNPTTQ